MEDIGDNVAPIPSDNDFAVNDVVLAYHGHLLYEARVLSVHREEDDRGSGKKSSGAKKGKSSSTSGGADEDGSGDRSGIDSSNPNNSNNTNGGLSRVKSYTVHYQGWKKSWEETVGREMVFEHNDENLRVAHQLLNGARLRQQALQPATPSSDTTNHKGDTSAHHHRHDVSQMFVVPTALQRQLVDDWEFITKEYRLVTLPRSPNVVDVLQKWVAHASKRSEFDALITREMADSLQYYFDASVMKILLYRFERKQYVDYFAKQAKMQQNNQDQMMGSNGNGNENGVHNSHYGDQQLSSPSLVYGTEHLLRLVHKLPFILENSSVPQETMSVVADRVNDLIKFLHRNGRNLFLMEYVQASKAYVKSATSVA